MQHIRGVVDVILKESSRNKEDLRTTTMQEGADNGLAINLPMHTATVKALSRPERFIMEEASLRPSCSTIIPFTAKEGYIHKTTLIDTTNEWLNHGK